MAPSVGEKISEVTLYSPRMKKCVFLNKNHQLLDFWIFNRIFVSVKQYIFIHVHRFFTKHTVSILLY